MTAIEQLCAAVENSGRYPKYHHEILRKHRKEWPTLWAAIDRLLKEGEHETKKV